MHQSSRRRIGARRRSARIAVIAVVFGAMISSTLVASADETTLRSEKVAAVSDLVALTGFDSHDQKKHDQKKHDQKNTGFDSHDQKKLDRALRNLDKGLADKFWSTDGDALIGKGEHVFRYDAKAIRELQKVDDPAVDLIVDRIVAIDFDMARVAVDSAAAAGADTTKVERTMAKAAEAIAKSDLSKAVDLYGTAWRNAARAKPAKPSKAGPSSGARFSTYEVVLVRTDTVSTGTPEFLWVSGSNESGDTGRSTEGYLFSSEFGPDDTSLDPFLWPSLDGGIMQLHVSCSDVFAGGFGSKSDPAATSRWLVNSIHIVKHRGETTDKECEVIGVGLDEDDEFPPKEM